MEFFNPKKINFDITKYFKIAGIFSVILSVGSIVLLVNPGINYGIDFRGGIEAQIQFPNEAVDIAELRGLLNSKMDNLSVVAFSESTSNDFIITAQSDSKESISTILNESLTEKFGPQTEGRWKLAKMDVVGSKVGATFRKDAFLSLLYACLLIILYMYWRFDARFSPGAIACIFHDLLIVCGFLVLTQREFSTTIVAALLALAGYSINDTVVIFDRIRETEGKLLGKEKRVVVREAINSTLSRTVITTLTTLISCAVLYFVGGPSLQDFAATLFFGVVFGTYSSLFVASPMFLWGDRMAQKNKKAASAA